MPGSELAAVGNGVRAGRRAGRRWWLRALCAVAVAGLWMSGGAAQAAVAGGVIVPVSAPGVGYVADENHPFPFMAFVPTGYDPAGAACPLVFCLCGNGEVGNGTSNGTLVPGTTNQLANVLGNGPLALVNGGSAYFGGQSAIVVQPQSVLRDGPAFSLNRVDLTMKLVLASYHIDPARIYCVGLGSGAGALMRWAYADADSSAYHMAAVVPVANTQGLGTTYTDFSHLAGTITWFVNDSDDATACPLFQTGRIWNGFGDGWAGGISRYVDQAVNGGTVPASTIKARCLTTHPDVIAISASGFNTTTVIPATALSGTYTAHYDTSNAAGWTWVPGQTFTAGSRVQLTLRQGGGFGGWLATFGTAGQANQPFWDWLFAQRQGQVPSGYPIPVAGVQVTPAVSALTVGQTLAFTATAVDAGGAVVAPQPFFTWSCSAGGRISGAGVFTATVAASPAIITATLPGTAFSATAAVTVAGAVLGECMLWPQGGGVSGCGMLARYGAPGPGSVTVERDTVLGQDSGLAPITLVTVVDPTGHTAAVSEMTDQATTVSRITIPVPAGPAGIWRVSVQGGRQGDRIIFTVPPSTSTGVRGEMALGQYNSTARSGWIWVPPGTGDVLIENIYVGSPGGSITLSTAAGVVLPGVPEGTRSLSRWKAGTLPTGVAIRIAIAAGTRAIAIDGMPGLICPDAATAADLQGGTVTESGAVVEGPLQARARHWMVAALATDLDPHLVFPAVPANQADPIAILQLYGNYGPLSGLRAAEAAQVLDPASMFFGSLGGTADGTLHGPSVSQFDAIGLAAAVAAGPALNPGHANPALIARTALLAFHHLSRMQGDDLLREGDIAATGYPMTHAFFTYLGSIAGPYPLMHPVLDATSDAIWRDGLIAVGDRLADYHGYETNQWWHIVLGHLDIYRATGETRFKGWFERQVGQLLNRPADSTSLFGQHPAGYFLENNGPDGNYDAISDTCLAEAWHDYKALPDADPAVLATLQNAIAKNLVFTSCHWLPQPDGSVVGPTAMVTRKVTSFASQGWPGSKFARDGFGLAAAQWLLTPVPAGASIGVAEAFPHFVNDANWARRALAIVVPIGDSLQSSATRGIPAEWTNEAIVCADLPVVAPSAIPCRTTSGVWDLPGQVAWKTGAIYGLSFYGVPGSAAIVPPANCRIGGGPSALWSAGTGTFLLSLHNTHFEDGSSVGDNGVASLDDLTHACVYGALPSGGWASGHEQGTLTWTTPGQAFRISGSPMTWDYAFGTGAVDITAGITLSGLTVPELNLPFPIQAAGAKLALVGPGAARFSTAGGAVDVTWDGGVTATVSALLATGITATPTPSVQCLRIPLRANGAGWTQHVHFAVVGAIAVVPPVTVPANPPVTVPTTPVTTPTTPVTTTPTTPVTTPVTTTPTTPVTTTPTTPVTTTPTTPVTTTPTTPVTTPPLTGAGATVAITTPVQPTVQPKAGGDAPATVGNAAGGGKGCGVGAAGGGFDGHGVDGPAEARRFQALGGIARRGGRVRDGGLVGVREAQAVRVPPVVAIVPAPDGCAVHVDGRSRLLPWEVAAEMLDDPDLVVQTMAAGELSPWDGERLLAALVAGDGAARSLLQGEWPPTRRAVHDLPRHARRWKSTVDVSVVVGDLDATCCRAGLALAEGDPLREVAMIALLGRREAAGLAVRQRLLDDHPWIGDAAWMASVGLLAENVVLQGLRRDQVRVPVATGEMPVAELLGGAERFSARRDDVAAAMRSILDGEAGWNDRGHLAVRPAAGWHHVVGGIEVGLGVGGMHSADPPGVVAGPLMDLDVASYYPSIIARDGINPPQLPDFSQRVGTLMARRIAAKRARDGVASNALKYVINSLYGQLGNRRSGLFSPPDALRVVLTGQLRLLELIDGVLSAGGALVSVNTDGVVVRGDVAGAIESAAAAWEARTGLNLERTPYQRLWRTSVNDYIATGPDGAVVKTKGKFAGGDDEDATRRAAAPIVARAALEHLVHGARIAEVVAQATAVTDFALWRRARDLAWGGKPVTASVVRWVVGKRGDPIVQLAEDGRVRSTVAARAIQVLDPALVDVAVVDRGWYVAEAQALVDKVMATAAGAKQMSLLDGGG